LEVCHQDFWEEVKLYYIHHILSSTVIPEIEI
jgi:hypothetical protein